MISMGVHLTLANQNGTEWLGREAVNEFYDYLVEKELESDTIEEGEELFGELRRENSLNHIEESDNNRTIIWFKIYSDMSPVGTKLPDEIWYDKEKIRRLRDGFRERKEELKEEKPETNWERTIELQHIAICEFALEHDFGVGLSV